MESTERRLDRRGMLAALTGGTVAWLVRSLASGVARAGQNDPVLQGANNDAGTTETALRSDPSGDHATLAVYNETGTLAAGHMPDTLRVFNSADQGGAAIQGFGGQLTFSQAPVHGLRVRGRGVAIGVSGEGVASDPSLAALGVQGVGDGDQGIGVFGAGFEGVVGRSEVTNGAGVRAIGTGDAQALQVSGDPAFSTANSTTVPQGATVADVAEPTRPGALILATLQTAPGKPVWVKSAQRVAQGQQIRITLSGPAPKDLRVAYLVMYHVPIE